eukprot:CAMPEP_0185599576 /NCGR_PEP_ID=MMETSP0434-20130131/82801_1 /TAXON_ID=626734 ORGANISM="Favella taraikaensis, Strain Fe Narragansett Bay" /NCGR_SAMPLE_ID=MMETSP0434 /ASSEMBLY_ACC=CAM_ASM_000379 /LENGTH=54 /DNA_ID=CAMNT_0028229033 /DNA_START=1822 /DNA_END=1986 /DNA_ORIENTATION=-
MASNHYLATEKALVANHEAEGTRPLELESLRSLDEDDSSRIAEVENDESGGPKI